MGTLTATLDLGAGNVARYSVANATNAGTWDDPDTGIRQTVYHAVDPAFPDWWLQFCTDADGKHDEVIVGRGTPSRPPSNWRTPYTATFMRDGVAFHTANVAKHFWYSCWRHTPAMRPVVRTPATLKARGWIPPFGAAATPATAIAPTAWPAPMTLPAGVFYGMGTAGDNPQIGLLSEAGAAYMITESADALTTLLAEAESGGTWQVHMYETDGRMINVRAGRLYFPEFGAYGGGVVNGPPEGEVVGDPVLDGAHQYASANAAWLLTGDPFYARFIAGICQWHQLSAGYHRINQHIDGLFYPGQTRAMAWGLRDCSLLACTIPVSTPSWMLARSQWAASLEDNRTFAMKWVNDAGPMAKRFQAWTRPDIIDPWMQAWLSSVVGIIVMQGFAAWRPVFDWAIRFQIAQTNGASGWDRRMAAEYEVYCSTVGVGSDHATCDAHALADWAAASAYHKAGSGGATAVLDDSNWGPGLYSGNSSYCSHVRAALAIASNLGVPGARACYDWLHAAIISKFGIGFMNSRFAVDAVINPDTHHEGDNVTSQYALYRLDPNAPRVEVFDGPPPADQSALVGELTQQRDDARDALAAKKKEFDTLVATLHDEADAMDAADAAKNDGDALRSKLPARPAP